MDEETELREIANPTGDSLVPVVKAHFVGEGSGVQSTLLTERSAISTVMGQAGALEPAYDPHVLALIFENSSALRPNVDAYVANIDSFGHYYEPNIELTAADADEKIRDALRIERALKKSDGRYAMDNGVFAVADEPTDEDVAARKEQLEKEIRTERALLASFFENCTVDMPFSGPEGLRGLTRQDIEVIGTGYWEVLRNGLGQICQFNHIPAVTMRLLPMDRDVTEVEIERRVSILSTERVTVRKRFRRYIQSRDGRDAGDIVYFKEFGDPRIISSKSGKVYASLDEMRQPDEEKDSLPATEVFCFKISSPRSPYGVPRWIGSLLAVMGTRQAEEVNFLFFENRSVPPMAILVSGGRLNDNTVGRLEDYIKTEIRGKRNIHKIMILEAESQDATPGQDSARHMKIELRPLTDAIQKDAHFQGYDERNEMKVGQSFRLPPILRGNIKDFNRSCYSEDTETLTENGWKTWDQIGPEEKIAAYDPKTEQVCFVVPQKKLVYDVVDEQMYRFHNKKTDCLVTRDHRMFVKPGKDWKVLEAQDVNFERFKVKIAGSSWEGREENTFVLPKSCKIERGHQHPSAVKFDDWLEFLGYFISEGGLVRTDHPAAEYLVYIDQKKPDVLRKIRDCLDRLGWKYSTQLKPCGTTHMLFSNRCLRDWLLKNVGHNSHDWRIPTSYLSLSHRQLHILFDAMMAGDGTASPKSHAYYSASRTLVDQVQQILVQTGYRAHIRRVESAGVWRVCFSPGTETRLSTVGGKKTLVGVEHERYTGKVYCFSVPQFGFFVTRRNGKVAIQGNTAAASIDFAEIQVFGPIRQQFDWVMNKLLFPELGAKYHSFKSNAPTVRDPEQLARMIALIHGANITTGNEARDLSQNVFNRSFDNLTDDWSKKPFAIALAETNQQGKDDLEEAGGLSGGNSGQTQRQVGVRQEPKTMPPDREKPKPKSDDKVRAMAKASIALRAALLDAEREELEQEMEGDRVVIKVPQAEWESWWKKPA